MHFLWVTTIPSLPLLKDEGRVEETHDGSSCWPPLSPRGPVGIVSPHSSRTVFMSHVQGSLRTPFSSPTFKAPQPPQNKHT